MAVGDCYELRYRVTQAGVVGASSFYYEQTRVPEGNEKFSANLTRAFYSPTDGVEGFLRPMMCDDAAVPVCQAAKVYDPSNEGDDIHTQFDDTFVGNNPGSLPPAIALQLWQTGVKTGNQKFASRGSYLMGVWDQMIDGPYCTSLASKLLNPKTPGAADSNWRLVVPERSKAPLLPGVVIGVQVCDLVFPQLWPTNVGSRQARLI